MRVHQCHFVRADHLPEIKVEPDVQVPAGEALDVAKRMAAELIRKK